MERRDFLKGMAAGAGLWSSGAVWSGASSGSPKLLVVMLRGAYDAASFLAPVGSGDYHAARPTIALGAAGSGANGALQMGDGWGLHPKAESFKALYDARQAIVVPFSGNATASRSHFEAQDMMEAGRANGAKLDLSSGWLGRLMDVLGANSKVGAMGFGGSSALSLKGSKSWPNVSGGLGKPVDERLAALMRELYGGSSQEGFARQGIEARERVARDMSGAMSEMEASSRGAAPAGKALSTQFAQIARIMREDPMASVGFVDVGGWDTHAGQGAATGALAGKFESLSGALAAAAIEFGPQWRDACVLVLSEFGRSFRENGSRGTDHGHGTLALVLGGALSGGRVAGRQEAVSFSSLNEGRDFKVLNDYRGVAAEAIGKLYGLGAKDLERVLPGAPKLGLGLF